MTKYYINGCEIPEKAYLKIKHKCDMWYKESQKLQQENQQLKEQLKLVESLSCFNMPDNMPMVCMTKADYERNKYEYETLDKYKSVLDEIREYIENNSLYEEEYDYDYEETMYLSGISDEKAKQDLLQILDKVK